MPFLGIGGRREQEENLKATRDSREVRFWKSELDKGCEEKNQWVGKFAAAARTNTILRAELSLLQKDSLALRSQLELNVRRSIQLPGGWVPGWADDIGKPAALPQQQPQPKRYLAAPGVRAGARAPQLTQQAVRDVRSPRDQPGGAKQQQAREAARATPAKQAPAEQPSDESGQAQQAQQEQQAQQAQLQLHGAAASLAKSQAEVATLRRQLREAGAYVARMEKDLEQQRKQHDNEKTLLTATAEAYRNEADLLREQVTFQHGINDFTADETLKLHSELGRLQQSNASLQRDVSLKDGMIHLLQQEVAEEMGSDQHTPPASVGSRIEEELEDEESEGWEDGGLEDGTGSGRLSPLRYSGGVACSPAAHGAQHAHMHGSSEGFVWSGVTPARTQTQTRAVPASPTVGAVGARAAAHSTVAGHSTAQPATPAHNGVSSSACSAGAEVTVATQWQAARQRGSEEKAAGTPSPTGSATSGITSRMRELFEAGGGAV